jgi:hypothetical protein
LVMDKRAMAMAESKRRIRGCGAPGRLHDLLLSSVNLPLQLIASNHLINTATTLAKMLKALLIALLPAASAHFHLNYPYWRADSLTLATTNTSITQWNYPCESHYHFVLLIYVDSDSFF